MTSLSGTVTLQSAEHLYTLRELMEIFQLDRCVFVRDQMQRYLVDVEAKRQQAAREEIPSQISADECSLSEPLRLIAASGKLRFRRLSHPRVVLHCAPDCTEGAPGW